MTDTYTDPNSTYDPNVMMPQVAAAAMRDPRRMLAQSLLAQSQAATSRPSYSKFSTLANALTGAIGGIAPTVLNNEYQTQNKGVLDTMQKASQAATTAPWTNPDTGQVVPGTGGMSAMAQTLMQNPLTATQGMQMLSQQAQLQAKAKIDQANKMAEQHLTYDANGNVVPQAGAPAALGAINSGQSFGTASGTNAANAQPGIGGQAAVINSTIPAEAAKSGAITAATLNAQAKGQPAVIAATAGPEAAAAAQKAAATAPIEVFKAQFNPQVDRATGELVIPGLDPEVTGKIMAAMGIDKNALAASMGRGAPGAVPGAPPAAGVVPSATSGLPAGNATAAPPVAPGNIPPALPAIAPPVAAPPVTAKPLAGQTAAPGAAPAPPVPYGAKSPADEVPTVGLPTGLLPKGPGTIIQGRDPVAIAAGEGAVKQADEQYHDTQEAAKGAGQVHSDLGTMRTMLQNGGFNTNASAPARQTLSAYLNATMGPDIAKSVTGIDPAQAEVFNKDATRMGLTFARQTEGAREALASIKIALGANPSLANTMEGNKKIIDLLDAGAQHDLAAQQYGDAYFNKNSHYVGFQGWMNQNHPPAEFTSKVVPYNAPRAADGSVDPSQLQPNVTYMGANGPGIWTGAGFRPVK